MRRRGLGGSLGGMSGDNTLGYPIGARRAHVTDASSRDLALPMSSSKRYTGFWERDESAATKEICRLGASAAQRSSTAHT